MTRRQSVWLAVALFAFLILAGGTTWVVYGWLYPAVPPLLHSLPEAQTLAYADLRPLRAAGLLGTHAIQHDGDYATFLADSGFDFERDLDQVAMAMQGTPNGPHRTLALLEGTFSPHLLDYLRQHAAVNGAMAGHELWQFPPSPTLSSDNQPLLLLQLAPRRMALSNSKELLEQALNQQPSGWRGCRRGPLPQLWRQLGAAQPRHALAFLIVDYAGLAASGPAAASSLPTSLEGSRLVALSAQAHAAGLQVVLFDQAVSSAEAGHLLAAWQNGLEALRHSPPQASAEQSQPQASAQEGKPAASPDGGGSTASPDASEAEAARLAARARAALGDVHFLRRDDQVTVTTLLPWPLLRELFAGR